MRERERNITQLKWGIIIEVEQIQQNEPTLQKKELQIICKNVKTETWDILKLLSPTF